MEKSLQTHEAVKLTQNLLEFPATNMWRIGNQM